MRPASSFVVLLAAMYAVCSDPGSASRHLSSKYRAACKAAEARVAKFAVEPQQASTASLWDLLSELLQVEQPATHPTATEQPLPFATGRPVPEAFLGGPLFQRPPPARG